MRAISHSHTVLSEFPQTYASRLTQESSNQMRSFTLNSEEFESKLEHEKLRGKSASWRQTAGTHPSAVIIRYGSQRTRPPAAPIPSDSLFNCIVSICAVAVRLSPAWRGGTGRRERRALPPTNQNANIRLPIGALVHLWGRISRL